MVGGAGEGVWASGSQITDPSHPHPLPRAASAIAMRGTLRYWLSTAPHSAKPVDGELMNETDPHIDPRQTMLLEIDYRHGADRDQTVHNLLTQKVFPRQAYVVATADLSNLLASE